MDDTPINLENILKQAPGWTFAGDFTLLQWMKQISQDLERRAIKTTAALSKLDNNVRSTNIALDNVANSLTTLQFGNQFVECRVHDDDETLINANKESGENQKQSDPAATSKELLNTFLDNNLKILRNCYEKYSIDLDDSDDEENSKEKTFIYQPINPYNDRPLPFIFGSKDWHAKWHVGICENQQENSYSGDEISDAYSESSSTSRLDDIESFESNTEWASSNSIDIENLNSNIIEIKNASSLRGSQQLCPVTPVAAIKTKSAISESSSPISTSSSLLAKKSSQSVKPKESFTQRSESINSITSKNSFQTPAKAASSNKENNLQYKTQTQKFVDLFAEPPDDLQSTTSSSISSAQNIIRPPYDDKTTREEKPSTYRTQPAPFVDLFAEPSEDIPTSTTSSMSSVGQNIRRKTVNLFDEEEDNVAKDDLLTGLTKQDELLKPKSTENKKLTLTKSIDIKESTSFVPKTAKSLFDDSDDDIDFLKAFVRKPSNKDTTKTLLFHDEIPTQTVSKASDIKVIAAETHSKERMKNIFDDTEDNENGLIIAKTTKDETKISISNPKINDVPHLENFLNKPTTKENLNLFNDCYDVPKKDPLSSPKLSTKINLFNDLDDNDDDLFSIKTKTIASTRKISTSRESEEKPVEDLKNVGSEKITKNQLVSSSNTQVSSLSNAEESKVREIEVNDQTVIQKITENTIDTVTFQTHKELSAEKQIFESTSEDNYTQCQKNLNENNSATIVGDLTASVTDNVIEKPGSSNNYEFNSILFLDEPPEDDKEFFETLSKTPNTLNSNYNSIDLENDIYEPELPKVPISSASNNPTDTADSFYTGLQLFSDIPPDDDDEAAGGDASSNIPPAANQTKRLHSVFYDDFNETLMALNQKHKEKENLNHSVFSQESTYMNEATTTDSKDITDHKVPDDKQEIKNADYKSNSLGIATTLKEEGVPKSDDKKAQEFSNKRPVSKLQMPHININVQALLPGANNTLRKAKVDITNTSITNTNYDGVKPTSNISKRLATDNVAAVLNEHPRSAETEHILPNLTKNRVKASTARRPSSRRARQDNYRKSLIEQQQTQERLESDGETSESRNETNNRLETNQTETKRETDIPQTAPMQVKPNNTIEVPKQNPEETVSDILRTRISKSTSMLLEDKYQDIKNNALEVKRDGIKEESSKYLVKSSLDQTSRNTTFSPKNVNDGNSTDFKQTKISKELDEKNEAGLKTKQKRVSLFFEDDDEDDDDFFAHIKTSKLTDTNKALRVKENKETETVKSSTETCEPTASSSSRLKTNNINIGTTKEVQVLPLIEEQMSYETKVKDEENLFHKSHVSAICDVKTTQNKSKSFLSEEDDYDDDLFKTNLQQPRKSYTNNRDRNALAKSRFKSFLDSESDEEKPSVAKTQIISTQTATTKMPNVSIPKNNVKLFTASESDSDDLFGKLSSTKTIKNKISTKSTSKNQTKPQSKYSLFADGSDSDDFLTSSTSASKNSESKGALKKNTSKPITTQTSTSLFSDLDSDEDDLFGGGTTKAKTPTVTNIPNTKTAAPAASKPTTAAVEIPKLKTVDDNPLADLL